MYYDQMRAAVKYFVTSKGKKTIGSMYQDSDFGRDVHAGVVAQLERDGDAACGTDLAQADRHGFQWAAGELRYLNRDLGWPRHDRRDRIPR